MARQTLAPIVGAANRTTNQLKHSSCSTKQERYNLSIGSEQEIPVTTSHLNQIPLQDEVLVLGGGVAGCAASIALARKGRSVTLIEREPTPRDKVCGEFLSGEALEDLHALGIDVASLGAVPIDYVRLAAARRAAEAPLPFPAASLTRKTLDTCAHRRGHRRWSPGRARPQRAGAQPNDKRRLASYARQRRHP